MAAKILAASLCLIAGTALAPAAFAAGAATYPDNTVHFVTGYPPGGGTDLISRLMGDKLTQKWGQRVIVDNRPGADGKIAENVVAQAPPDGYSVSIVNNNHTLAETDKRYGFDPIKSFAPVMMIASAPQLIAVRADAPYKSMAELIAYAKANPGKATIGVSGEGSVLELELLKHLAGIDFSIVKYKGSNPAMLGVLSGEIDMAFSVWPTFAEQVKAGKLTILAATSNKRSPLLPDVPAIAETPGLKDYDAGTYFAALVPAGTPPEIIKKLHDDMASVLALPDVQKALASQGYTLVANSPEAFGAFSQKDFDTWNQARKSLKPS